MDASGDNTFSELVALFKSWIPWRPESTNVSRDFWMPDQSCRVCYDCDSQFTIINRRHHCRLCGRVFCAKCTANSVPNPSGEQNTAHEEWEKIRVCNYCFKQWTQSVSTCDSGTQVSISSSSASTSAASLESIKSGGTINSSIVTLRSLPYFIEPGVSPHQSTVMETSTERQDSVGSEKTDVLAEDMGVPSLDQYGFSINRSDDEDDDYGVDESDSGSRCFPQDIGYYDPVNYDMNNNGYDSRELHHDGDNVDIKNLSSTPIDNSFDLKFLEGIHPPEKKEEQDVVDNALSSSPYAVENVDESNAALWNPPAPEDEEDEREPPLPDDDDEDGGEAAGEWGYLRPSTSFGSGEHRNRDRSIEEHKTAMKSVVDGHFRALIAQLLQVENVPVGEQNDKDSWLEIITSLSWEAATLLKPDTSKGGGMDPGGYVKIKCIASGRRCESMVVKGVVCKKNVAHRRMASKFEKPRLLILGGALEYQRVSNLLSSFDTLLQQEMDHLKMAVAKIDAHHPDVLLVEKSVSRFAQEYLLGKNISLVLNIKRPLLERISRCTGAQIVPSIDNISSQKLGYCDMFHVDRILENHGTAGKGGSKTVKTLMYFEGCPKPLGYTILLRGANGDELKKVKHVVQYGVFAAYHLALETSFLVDEGASLPEFPLNAPLTVALPDKPSSIDRSISTIPGFSLSAKEKLIEPKVNDEPRISNYVPSSVSAHLAKKHEIRPPPYIPNDLTLSPRSPHPTSSFIGSIASFALPSSATQVVLDSSYSSSSGINMIISETSPQANTIAHNNVAITGDHLVVKGFDSSEAMKHIIGDSTACEDAVFANQLGSDTSSSQQYMKNQEPGYTKEEFPPTTNDHQSILVSLSSRCHWKGTVCERSHLFRIKYYGSFDKPLGRFLRDHLFDQGYRCRFCDTPTEGHVYCYTHRQGTLTISVKKLTDTVLPGEKEGKIWMWHRCLQCPRSNGFPPSTRRVVMSDAAWGLSFGKFLELSFSNHAAASRVASCGHSLHRDCLRFYGYGKMVACFRYASIDVNSVYLPPAKLDFNHKSQEWIQKETIEVVDRAELLFSEILNALSLISAKNAGPDSRRQVVELEGMLHKEKMEFEESLQKITTEEGKKGKPFVDILEINRLRRQLLFQSYMWDHRLVYAANIGNSKLRSGTAGNGENNVDKNSMLISTKVPSESDSLLVDGDLNKIPDHDVEVEKDNNDNPDLVSPGIEIHQDETLGEIHEAEFSARENGSEESEALDTTDGQFQIMENLSDTLDSAWRGETLTGDEVLQEEPHTPVTSDLSDSSTAVAGEENIGSDDLVEERGGEPKVPDSSSPLLDSKNFDDLEDSVSWLRMPFLNFYRSLNKNFLGTKKFDTVGEYKPVYVSSFRESELQGGARLFLPLGPTEIVIPVYDDEPTSAISYALVSPDYRHQLSEDMDRPKDSIQSFASMPLFDSFNLQSMSSFDETASETNRSLGTTDDSFLSFYGSRSLMSDPLSSTKALHVRVSFSDNGTLGQVKYTVTCYYARRFESLRKMCCPSELDFIRSLSRCKKWGAQGGKSNVFFAKTLDDRFIIKQVTKTELESFIQFAPEYFKYLSESIGTGSPTCLAKVLGIYQVTSKHLKGGKESRMDVLVMENLLYGRNITRLYDLKGSCRSRYNPDVNGSNKVLLDQNLIEAMPTSPIFVGNKAKRLLERAVWNDTSFLASVDVMDYSLLVGLDEENHELVLGIIDFMRQYTWDKHLETWVKASGILGGPKNATPTVISPKQYKKRFRKAMTTYFLMLPDQWSPATITPSKSQTDLLEENTQQDGNASTK